MDSKSVFLQRLRLCAVPDDVVTKLVAVGVDSLSKLAFCTSYQPTMQDDTPLTNFFKAAISPGVDIAAGTMATLRRAFFEAHTFMLSDLKGKIDKKEEDAPRRVPQAERNSRLEDQQRRLIGLDITGVMEPSDSLIDIVSQQHEDERLRFIELEVCTTRESELRANKVSKANKADLSSDLLVRQAMQRRALAYDQLNIFNYAYLEKWHAFLFNLVNREPVKIEGAIFNRVSLSQVLEADKQAYILASDKCRTGLQQKLDSSFPAEAAFDEAKSDPLVISLLQPLQTGRGQSMASHKQQPNQQRTSQVGQPQRQQSSGTVQTNKVKQSKGSKKAKRQGPACPKELIGLNLKTKAGEPICYSYNLSGCTAVGNGEKCNRGHHVCAKCLGMHSRAECPRP